MEGVGEVCTVYTDGCKRRGAEVNCKWCRGQKERGREGVREARRGEELLGFRGTSLEEGRKI